jgi:hypothetical protein
MQWPYPRDGEDPWYSSFEDMVRAMDASSIAVHDQKNVILSGGGVISWDATTGIVSWALPIMLNSSQSGFAETIPAGSLEVPTDGLIGYVSFITSPSDNVTVELFTADVLPAPDVNNTFVLFRRRQNKLFWRNGGVLGDGDSLAIIDDGPGGGGAGNPAGANTEVQFNNAGVFGASPDFTWTGTEVRAPVLAMPTGLAPAPTATFGKLFTKDDRPFFIDAIGQQIRLATDQFTVLPSGGAVNIDFDTALPSQKQVTLNADATFTSANLGAGRGVSVRVICDGTNRNLNFPVGWIWLGGAPTSIDAGTTGMFSAVCFGATDADVVAAWNAEGLGGGGVTAVTASAPLASSGGATPDISLTGIVPVPNGGTGLATLTANAVILGNGVSPVLAVSPGPVGEVLTSNGTTWTSAPPTGGSASTVDLITTGLTVGDGARVSGTGTAGAANGTAISVARLIGITSVIGGVGVGKVQVSGIHPAVNFISGLTLNAGDPVYLSLTSGKFTNDVNAFGTGNVVAELGIVTDATAYDGVLNLTAAVLIQLKSVVII